MAKRSSHNYMTKICHILLAEFHCWIFINPKNFFKMFFIQKHNIRSKPVYVYEFIAMKHASLGAYVSTGRKTLSTKTALSACISIHVPINLLSSIHPCRISISLLSSLILLQSSLGYISQHFLSKANIFISRQKIFVSCVNWVLILEMGHSFSELKIDFKAIATKIGVNSGKSAHLQN